MPSSPNVPDPGAYVEAACAVLGLDLPADARERVAAQLARIGDVAGPVLALDLPDETEIAPVFRP